MPIIPARRAFGAGATSTWNASADWSNFTDVDDEEDYETASAVVNLNENNIEGARHSEHTTEILMSTRQRFTAIHIGRLEKLVEYSIEG